MSGSASMLCTLAFTSRLIRAMACSPGLAGAAHSIRSDHRCGKHRAPLQGLCETRKGRVCITFMLKRANFSAQLLFCIYKVAASESEHPWDGNEPPKKPESARVSQRLSPG